MKNKVLAVLILSVSYLFAAPAFADNIIQIWECQLHDGKTGADAMAVSSTWLDAAKKIEGGEDFNVLLRFPIAANAGDDSFRCLECRRVLLRQLDVGRCPNRIGMSPGCRWTFLHQT